jgi:DNA replication initiation complex subunit (GINS family)
MIAFSDIYEAMRKEKYSEQLQFLPKKFLLDVSNYFKEKKEFLDGQDDPYSDISIKNKKKLENAHSSFRDLLRIRKKKILNLSFVASEVGISKKDFENLLSFEKDLFEEIVKSLERAEKNLSADMVGSNSDERKHELVRFLENVPEFLDFNGGPVGPFEKGEIANLEREIVEILSKDRRVEILEED